MSRFVGPVHHWLYNKISIHENLEKDLVSAFEERFGQDVSDIVKKNREQYGDLLPDKPLEEIIDSVNIHGWLQSKISIVETRQANILGDLFDKYKTDGVLLANSIYEQNGTQYGKDASNKYNLDSAAAIHKILNDYILDGMPCDNASSITKNEKDYLEFVQSQCLHIGYWNKAGVDPNKMYDLRKIWNEAFVNAANSSFKYQVDQESINGQEGFRHKIFKK